MSLGTLKVEITGNHRVGTAAKSGKPYCMYQAFVHLPNVPYPQMMDFYAETPQQVPQAGVYDCDVIVNVRDSRLQFDVDPRQGRRTNLPPLSAAPKVGAGAA